MTEIEKLQEIMDVAYDKKISLQYDYVQAEEKYYRTETHYKKCMEASTKADLEYLAAYREYYKAV